MIPFSKTYTSSLIWPFCYRQYPSKPRPCFACSTTEPDDFHRDIKSINQITKRKHRELIPRECRTHPNQPFCSCGCN